MTEDEFSGWEEREAKAVLNERRRMEYECIKGAQMPKVQGGSKNETAAKSDDNTTASGRIQVAAAPGLDISADR